MLVGDSHWHGAGTVSDYLGRKLRAEGHTTSSRHVLARYGMGVLGPRQKGVARRWFTDENRRLLGKLWAECPDLVIVGLGGNDAWGYGTANTATERTRRKAEYQQALIDFVGLIRGNGADVIWIGPPTVEDASFERARQRIRSYQEETMGALGVPWVDSTVETVDLPRKDDGAHMNAQGYALWAHRMMESPLAHLKRRGAAVSGFGELMPIFEPTHNMREVCKQLCLLEDHLNQRDKRCADCIRKHFLTIEGLIEEGIGLDKEGRHHTDLQGGLDLVRGAQKSWNDGKAPEPRIAQELRVLRKEWSEKTFGASL